MRVARGVWRSFARRLLHTQHFGGSRHLDSQQQWPHAPRRHLDTQQQWAHAPREKVECLVIGAGVIGLAVARALAMRGREVLVVEAASTFGSGTSSRNSEVIHAGIYYAPNSLKALLCVEGRRLLYSYCNEHDVPHKQIGKLIVATDSSHISELEAIIARGHKNGVSDLRFLNAKETSELEPNITCLNAVWSPSTGIIDSHSFMTHLQIDAEAHSTVFAFHTSVLEGSVSSAGIEVLACTTEVFTEENNISANSIILCANTVINAAGLRAVAVARKLKGFPKAFVPNSYFARGCYFSLVGYKKAPFSHLVYPIPGRGGLGVHVTLDLGGQVRFGPDVEWLDNIDHDEVHPLGFDYTIDPQRAEKFYPEIRKYYPALVDGALKADYSGIRSKISGPYDPPADFLIQGQDDHGICGLINLFGMESPGLTASLAIASRVCTMACGST